MIGVKSWVNWGSGHTDIWRKIISSKDPKKAKAEGWNMFGLSRTQQDLELNSYFAALMFSAACSAIKLHHLFTYFILDSVDHATSSASFFWIPITQTHGSLSFLTFSLSLYSSHKYLKCPFFEANIYWEIICVKHYSEEFVYFNSFGPHKNPRIF